MRFVDEYRDGEAVRRAAAAIASIQTRPWTLMEICGGQTHSILKFGLDQLLPEALTLVHGPGCPVCVTPLELIDQAVEIAARREVIFTSFGDMLRVPGSRKSLLQVKSEGGDVRVVYSPLDAVRLAEENPMRQVVFFAVGFETTAPANAMAVWRAHELGLPNFTILCSHVLVPPAIDAILGAPDSRIQGFLAAGHVCTVEGTGDYEPLARKYHVPIVVTGFEPVDLMAGILICVQALEKGEANVENAYRRSAHTAGNPAARALVRRMFRTCDRAWRGIGVIPGSGLALREEFGAFDAAHRFESAHIRTEEPKECIAGEILLGHKRPSQCGAFGGRCTPEHPLGAPMVSAEGACAAYYAYRRTA
ncbi:MAG: hydrogenase formation protein HypD [Vicinamibacteria bacterium]|nr:hydrogenase formation protein HypD [Vicinamibacteria bacterium]